MLPPPLLIAVACALSPAATDAQSIAPWPSPGGTGTADHSSTTPVSTAAVVTTNRFGAVSLNQAVTGAGMVEIVHAASGSTILGNASHMNPRPDEVTTGRSGRSAAPVSITSTILGAPTSSVAAQSSAAPDAGDGVLATDHGTLAFTPVGRASFNTIIDPVADLGSSTGTFQLAGNFGLLNTGHSAGSGPAFNLLDWSNTLTTGFAGLIGGPNFHETSEMDLSDIGAFDLAGDARSLTSSGNISPVPEPSRALLLMLGLLSLVTRRRR